MPNRNYAKTFDRRTGRRVKLHRLRATQLLGRGLWPGEIVHHTDGNYRNNRPSNLVVLPSTQHHNALEGHRRKQQRGMLPLFPELLEARPSCPLGSLWQAVQWL